MLHTRTRLCFSFQDFGQANWHWDFKLRWALIPEMQNGSGWGERMEASYLYPSIGGHCCHESMQAGHEPLACLFHVRCAIRIAGAQIEPHPFPLTNLHVPGVRIIHAWVEAECIFHRALLACATPPLARDGLPTGAGPRISVRRACRPAQEGSRRTT